MLQQLLFWRRFVLFWHKFAVVNDFFQNQVALKAILKEIKR